MKHASLLLVLILLLPLAHAATVDVRYDVQLTTTTVTYTFSEVNQPLQLPLPYDARQLTINNKQTPNQQLLTIEQDTQITFNTATYSRQRGYFTADLTRVPATINEVTIYLPEGARLQRSLTSNDPSIRPTPRDAFTDGKHLIFVYDGENLEPARAILIDYETTLPDIRTLLIIAATLILAGLLTLLLAKPRRNEDVTKNLYEEEKLLVELLLQAPKNELWQNQLTKKSGLNKVKASRKLRNLEQKGVIEKIPYGNTNKIRIRKNN